MKLLCLLGTWEGLLGGGETRGQALPVLPKPSGCLPLRTGRSPPRAGRVVPDGSGWQVVPSSCGAHPMPQTTPSANAWSVGAGWGRLSRGYAQEVAQNLGALAALEDTAWTGQHHQPAHPRRTCSSWELRLLLASRALPREDLPWPWCVRHCGDRPFPLWGRWR